MLQEENEVILDKVSHLSCPCPSSPPWRKRIKVERNSSKEGNKKETLEAFMLMNFVIWNIMTNFSHSFVVQKKNAKKRRPEPESQRNRLKLDSPWFPFLQCAIIVFIYSCKMLWSLVFLVLSMFTGAALPLSHATSYLN